MDIEGLHGLSDNQEVNQAQKLLDDIIKTDVKNAADLNYVTLLYAEAKKAGVNVPVNRLADVALSLSARQEMLKQKAKENNWVLKLASAPESAKQFVSSTVKAIHDTGKSVYNWASDKTKQALSWLGFTGLGEPVTISLTTLVVGSVLVGGVGVAAAYLIFKPAYENAAKDARTIDELRQYLEAEVKAGRLTREKADAIYAAVKKYGDDAYNEGKQKQWWESNKGWLKTLGVVAVTGATIVWGIPALKEKLNSKK